MKQMYAVVLGDDNGKTVNRNRIYSLYGSRSAANKTVRYLNNLNVKYYACKVMVDIVRVGDEK